MIVDFRYNFGGDGSHVAAVAREFIKREDKKPWRELYLITGRRTLSAGVMAAMAIMESTDRTVVGEPMAAPINSYGDPVSIEFQRTGLHLYLSTVRHQLGADNDVTELTTVDIPIQMSFSEYASGQDPTVDPILHGEEMRSLAIIALKEGGARARRVYEERKISFARYDWWSPPTELNLRKMTRELLTLGRYEDAIELAILNAQIHPGVWNTWYNLGVAQMAAGRQKEALENWKRVLELDPENDNGDEIRRAFTSSGAAMK
jgi:hypothetical protein